MVDPKWSYNFSRLIEALMRSFSCKNSRFGVYGLVVRVESRFSGLFFVSTFRLEGSVPRVQGLRFKVAGFDFGLGPQG